MKEEESTKNSHDISIALIQKDIEYIKQSMVGIQTQIQMIDKHYARHDDVNAVVKSLEEFKKVVDAKVNISDFEPIRNSLTRINWMLISAIVAAILGIVLKQNFL